jgi:hypothetical protein
MNDLVTDNVGRPMTNDGKRDIGGASSPLASIFAGMAQVEAERRERSAWWQGLLSHDVPGTICQVCRREIAEEAVWLVRVWGHWDSYAQTSTCYVWHCPACAEEASDCRWTHYSPEPCVTCGRLVYMPSCRTSVTCACSERCRRLHQRAREQARIDRKREFRVARRTDLICAGCGGTFSARRAGARTCSPRCRQRLHRRGMA